MAEVAGIAADSRRNHALYDIVADANASRVKELLDEADALGPVSHRPDIARILYIRFAVVAPEAAVDHLMARAYRTSWLTAVFRAWAHTDLDAAVARAQVLQGQAKSLAARAILELELPAWRRADIADHLDATETLASIRADEDLRGETDFAVAWRKALSVPDDRVRQQRLEEIVDAWAKQSPAAAMAAATELARRTPEDSFSDSVGLLLQASVIEVWATADTHAATAWIAEQDSTRTRQSTTTSLIVALARESVAAAISALDMLPQDLLGIAQRGLAASGREMSDADVDSLVGWYASLEPATQEVLAPFLSQTVVARDTQRAFDWAVSLRGDARTKAVLAVTWRISLADPELAKRLVKNIEDEVLQRIAADNLIYKQVRVDPREALEWAESFTSKTVRPELVRTVFEHWSNVDPDGAVREVLRLRDARKRDTAAHDIASLLLSQSEEYPRYVGLAERLFDAIRSTEIRRGLAKILHRHYSARYPDPDRARHYADLMTNDEG